MGNSFSQQFGSTLSHNQDLSDNLVHDLIKTSKKDKEID